MLHKGWSFPPQNSHREHVLGTVQTPTKRCSLKLFKSQVIKAAESSPFQSWGTEAMEGQVICPRSWQEDETQLRTETKVLLWYLNNLIFLLCALMHWNRLNYRIFSLSYSQLVVVLLWWGSYLRNVSDQSLNLHDLTVFEMF